MNSAEHFFYAARAFVFLPEVTVLHLPFSILPQQAFPSFNAPSPDLIKIFFGVDLGQLYEFSRSLTESIWSVG